MTGARRAEAEKRLARPYNADGMGDLPSTTMISPCILVIEDDPDIREVIRIHLEKAQFSILTAENGPQGLVIAQTQPVSLVILDLGLPGVDGLEICRKLSASTPRPLILILTARSSEVDRVTGLDRGADDYVVKPFSMPELVARVRALLRRPPLGMGNQEPDPARTIAAGSLVVDRWERCARLDARRIELTSKEFELLLWFVRHPMRVFSRAELLDAVWGSGYDGFEHTVNSHLNRLRAKIEVDPSRPALLVTVRGGGYKLMPPTHATAYRDPRTPVPPAAGAP